MKASPPVAVVVLGAGKPSSGSTPSALSKTTSDRRVLDWLIEAFGVIENADFFYVGGYGLDSVIKHYPNVRYSINENWSSSGSYTSLNKVALSEYEEVYVCYGDTVFRENVVSGLVRGTSECVIAIDTSYQERYSARTDADLESAEIVGIDLDGTMLSFEAKRCHHSGAEFTGLMKLSGQALQTVCALPENPCWGILDMLNALVLSGHPAKTVDIQGEWAELNAPQDLARFVLGTKAETLDRLRPLCRKAQIGEQVRLTWMEWSASESICLERIQRTFPAELLAVRSSSLSEDGWNSSNAGGYDSFLNVSSQENGPLREAVQKVFASYKFVDNENQVLVQRMCRDVAFAGVVFTRTIDRGAPYYIINYDDSSANTDTVTGGGAGELRTVVIHREMADEEYLPDPRLERVLDSVKEIEALVGYDSLDIEFACDSSGRIHILQVRPIAVSHEFHRIDDDDFARGLEEAMYQFDSYQTAAPGCLSERTIFAIMPDWNPAEIIGTKPRPLSLSLYQYLITDDIWAQQRAQSGYRDVRPQPLIVSFVGQPYVDTRASFTSFVPKTVSDDLACRLVGHYVEELALKPHLHDKVEFEIAFTAWTPDILSRLEERLPPDRFSDSDYKEIEEGLKSIFVSGVNLVDHSFAQLYVLEERLSTASARNLPPLRLAYILLEDCKRFGTLPFAHLARAGFVAASLLRSLVNTGVLTAGRVDDFMTSLTTVSSDFRSDASRVASGSLSTRDLVERYGHLRPGTYDITCSAYHEDPDNYIYPLIGDTSEQPSSFQWSSKEMADIGKILEEAGIIISIPSFCCFLRRAIEGREKAKFVFTRSLSRALDCIQQWGNQMNLQRDDLSYLHWNDFLRLQSGVGSVSVQSWVESRIEEGRESYRLTSSAELPALLVERNDFVSFEKASSQPNFVTNKRVSNEIVEIGKTACADVDLEGKIVLIPQADPGYDWLFGMRIGALVTMYGGANSHMAIRSAELGLPAAIGIGEKLYETLRRSKRLIIDCATRTIRRLA